MSDFKSQNNFEKRCSDSEKIKKRFPDKIPIIVDAHKDLELDKIKYLVPSDLKLIHFKTVLRKRLKLKAEQSLFLFCNNSIPQISISMAELYKEHRDKDGFLYLTITRENTFG